jgi:hypothetical protein
MADSKISNLTEITNPSGTDMTVVVNAGVTKKVTLSNAASPAITAHNADSANSHLSAAQKTALTTGIDANGQHTHGGLTMTVRNETGVSIPAMRAVYVVGFNNYPLVGLANNTLATQHHVIGITTSSIANGADGTIVTNGLLSGVDTNSFSAVGAKLYLTTSGVLSETPPSSGEIIFIGEVSVKDNNGKILLYDEKGIDYIAAYFGGDIHIRMGDSGSANKVVFEDYGDNEVAHIDSDGNLVATTINDSAVTDLTYIRQSEIDRQCSGLVSGGVITANVSGTTIDITSGSGYVNDHSGTAGTFLKVTFSAGTSVSLAGNGSNYIAVNSDGTFDISLTKQPLSTHIYLGHVYVIGGYVAEVFSVPEWTGHFQGRINEFVTNGIGAIVSSGLSISEDTTPQHIIMAAGTYYARLGEYTLTSKTSFYKMYKTADTGWEQTNFATNVVSTQVWNDRTKNKYGATLTSGQSLVTNQIYEIVSQATLDFTTAGAPDNNVGTHFVATSGTLGSGDSVKEILALVSLSSTSKWRKNLILTVPNGHVYNIYGDVEYSSEDDAKAGPLPTIPDEITQDSVYLSTVVSKRGDTSIANRIYDIRPILSRIFGYGTAGASGSVVSHNTLTNLDYATSGHTGFLASNSPITAGTKTKITYDADGLVTSGADATTADIADSSNKRYVTDANLTVLNNTSGTNTGDQTISDATLTTSDITTNNFTTAKHGFVPKGTNVGNFLKDDGTWSAVTASMLTGGYPYLFDTGTGGNPTAGKIQYNNAVPASATTVYISETDNLSVVIDTLLDGIKIGDYLMFYSVASSTKYHVFQMSAAFSSGAGVDTIPVTYAFGTGTFSNSETIALQLFRGTDYFLTEAPALNTTANGIKEQLVAGENLVFGDVCYFKSDGKLWKSSASTAGTYPALFMALGTITANNSGMFVLNGVVRNDTWNWTVGGAIYLSTTSGSITQTQPSATDNAIQVLGIATHADRLYFNPSVDYITHT